MEDIPNEREEFSIESVFILSRNWEFSALQPHLPSQKQDIFNNLLFYVKKNNATTEKMKLISLQENDLDEIPENFVIHSPKVVGKLEKFTIETNGQKCLNLAKIDSEELEKTAGELVNFSNEDNFLLYSKYWFYDFDFFHPELMSLAVYWKFMKPNGNNFFLFFFFIIVIFFNFIFICFHYNYISVFIIFFHFSRIICSWNDISFKNFDE